MASRRFLVVVSGATIYGAANPLRSDRRKYTKDSIATVRHLYPGFDIDGEARLTSLRTSNTVPTPTEVFSTSLSQYQILGRIDSFTFEQQESTLKLLAIPFGGDPASSDRKRVLRLSRFQNCKHDSSHPITVKYPYDSTSNPYDFRLDIPAANALPLPHAISSRKHPDKHTNSEHDWALIRHELAHGKDAGLSRERFLPTARITPSHRPDFASSKAFRWRTFVAPRLLCAVYPKGPNERGGGAAYVLRWSPRLLCGC